MKVKALIITYASLAQHCTLLDSLRTSGVDFVELKPLLEMVQKGGGGGGLSVMQFRP